MEELLTLMKRKLRITDTSEDAVLKAYLSTACSFVNNLRLHTGTDTQPVEAIYTFIVVDLAISAYNKEGAEGEVGHSENGISRNYDSSYYPSSIVSKIIPRARVYANNANK